MSIQLQSFNFVILLNPPPLISAIQALIDVTDIPMQPLVEEQKTEENGTLLSTNINVNFDNTSILLMTDRKEILRGILELKTAELTVKFQSSGQSGNLSISSAPISLHAGQITHYQSSSSDLANNGIEWKVMPFHPILSVHGAMFHASFKEKTASKESAKVGTLCVDLEMRIDTIALNTSPSTLVALIGFSSSLEPFMDWIGGDTEEEELKKQALEKQRQSLNYRREALRGVFNSVDVDESGTLQEDELEQVVLMLFAEDTLQIVNGAQRLTTPELKRERDYLISVLDSGQTNKVSYKEVDSILFRLAHGIDDNNLIPDMGVTGIDYLDNLKHSKSFLSAPMMRKLVYFDDLREYASMQEVYSITGCAKLQNGWTFPPPSLWHPGQGIALFWVVYEKDSGCSRVCLNAQDISPVQRKLVRSLW